jgi:hypothetical protein
MMKRQLVRAASVIALFFCIAWAPKAHGFLEFNTFYSNESLGLVGSTDTNNRLFWEVCLGFGIDKKSDYNVGWDYSSYSTSDSVDSVTTTYASTQMGPRFIVYFDKEHQWSLGLGYYLVTTGAYTSGSAPSETWKGTALKFDIGYNFPVTTSFFLGVRMNYSSASYASTLVGASTYSTDAHTKSIIYPSVYGIWMF